MIGRRRWFRWGTLAAMALLLGLWLSQGAAVGGRSAAVAQQPINLPPPELAAALPMISGTFEDPQGRFKIGLFDGYRVSTAGTTPLFQAPDGSLAYTVALTPLGSSATASDADLLRAAQATFGQGEGFTPGDVQAIPGGGVRINWTGSLRQGAAPPQPISGKIFARQRDRDVYLLLVAATDAAEAQLSDAITTLGSTLTVP